MKTFKVSGKKTYYCETLIDADDIDEATREFMDMDLDDMDYGEEIDSIVEEVVEDDSETSDDEDEKEDEEV
jgi:hypothetical protein